MRILAALIIIGLIPTSVIAQTPEVGREAAAKYFQNRNPSQQPSSFGGSDDHYLMLHFGRYMSSQSYEWSRTGDHEDVGGNSFGLTYRVGEWYNSMDLHVRVDYTQFKLDDENVSKISFMPMITFPDAKSRFPLYFGMGVGMGIFMKQIDKKSALSLDYQLVMGARFFNVFESTGFFVEGGLKNHLHLLSSGQLNGAFLAGGLVFTF